MTHSELNWFDRQVEQYEKSRFAAMTIMLTAQSCIGSIAAFFSMQHDNYALIGIGAAITMGSNSAFIAQGPAKWCLGLFYASVIINFCIIFINILTP